MKEGFLFFKTKDFSDPDGFAKLYDLYVQKIYRFVYFKVNNVEEAQDLTSQTFLKAWQYLKDADSDDVRNIRAFLYRVARNMVVDHYRAKGIETERRVDLDDMEYELPSTDDSLADLNRSFDKEMLLAGIKQLKPKFQDVILMRYVEDMKIEEVAQVLKKTNGATRVIIYRALQELKKILNESA